MRIIELRDLLTKLMERKGQGSDEITSDTGFKSIVDVIYCENCKKFHVLTKDKKYPV